MARDGTGSFEGELENSCSCTSQHVGPMDGVNIGGLGELLAPVPLPRHAPVFRVVELDHQPLDGLAVHLHINQDSPAAIGEPI